MALSFLKGDKGKIDSELDALFTVKPSQPKPILQNNQKQQIAKRKSTDAIEPSAPEPQPKRQKVEKSKKKERPVPAPSPASSSKKAQSKSKPSEDADENSNPSDSEEEDPSKLIHESLSGAKSSSTKKIKYVPEGETSVQRDARTIFVGNLSVQLAKQRPLQKALKRHILSFLPTAKIESIRMRSVPFSAPTTPLPSDPSSQKSKPSNHGSKRTSLWRQSQSKEDSEAQKDHKKFLTSSEKKKIAYITQDLHSSADTVHAYIVFAFPPPSEGRRENLPPVEVMDPHEAAKEAVRKADGSVFMERMIRVDLVGKGSTSSSGGQDSTEGLGLAADPKLSIFVGNLDFATKEEDLRVFFETLLKAERGQPSSSTGEDEGSGKWVTRVRIVRDRETQLGKGFAYVQLADRSCVDELVALDLEDAEDAAKLKFAKRKLRVQRCKTLPGSSLKATASASRSDSRSEKRRSTTTSVDIPKGNPALGSQLVHLSKDERKLAKAGDADRVARRLAKKKARNALQVPASSGGKKIRDRERRVRSKSGGEGGGVAAAKKKSVRVRSEKAVGKLNGKK